MAERLTASRERRRRFGRAIVALLAAGVWLAGLHAPVGAAAERGPAGPAAGWLGPPVVLAASPTPQAGGDTRSSDVAPGFVGAPLLAIGGVIGIGVLSVVLTLTYLRLTGPDAPAGRTARRRPPDRR